MDRASDHDNLSDDRLFRVHFDNLPGPAYMWQRDGDDFRLIAHNRAAGALPFSNVAKFVGMSVRELQRGSNHDMHADLELCAARGVIIRREVDHRYLESATVRRLALSLVPVSADIVVLHTEDITERQRTEEALRVSEQKYRTIVDTAHEGVLAVDVNSVATYINQRAAEILGYTPDELLGVSVFDFLDESLHEEALQIRARRHAGLKEHFDFRVRHKNGADVWISVAASPLLNDAGEVVGSLYMMSDITARKQAEQSLRESEARLRALLDANPDFVGRITRDGRYLDVHYGGGTTKHYLPRPSAAFPGAHVDDLFELEFAREHERHRLRALDTGEVQLWHYVRQLDGMERHFEARFVKSGADEVLVIVHDVTQRVELEREVVASGERERARIGHDLHDGLAQLLTGVKLMIEALVEKLGADGSPHRGDAERAVNLMSAAIGQTGELAQGLSPIRRGIRLCDALHQLAKQSQAVLGVACSFEHAETPSGLAETSATHLYRIAQEAITNAVKHGKATRIELRCERANQRFAMSVADNGLGIADTGGEHRGMGMHIMQYRARSIDGELVVAPRPGGGTIVTCFYPAPVSDRERSSRVA